MKGYRIVNLEHLIDAIGEEKAKALFADYSCPNSDVEHYLKHTAIPFIRNGLAKTHLVFASYNDKLVLVGYFTIANKTIIIRKSQKLNSKLRSRISRFAEYMSELQQYVVYAPLIAQLGKNFTNGYNRLITGDELLQMACNKVKEIHTIGGGKIAYVECEDIRVLTTLYERNGFFVFDRKTVEPNERNAFKTKEYVQMMKYF